MRCRVGVLDNKLGTAARRSAFAVLRARLPVWLHDAPHSATDGNLRLVHVGNRHRGRDFVERLYGVYQPGTRLGSAWVGPAWNGRGERVPEHDLLLLETSRLYGQAYRRAGFITVPEWVEFGREVVADEKQRYAGAGKSLRCDLKALRRSPLEAVISSDPAQFDLFHRHMYLPHMATRFGAASIEKPRSKLWRDFRAGFLLLLKCHERFVAGALVRVDGDTARETTLGVLEGEDEILRLGVSGAIDYHLHAWAAANGKRFLGVGHTRPFPADGVFFNKRKWQMSVMADADGVTDFTLKMRKAAVFPLEVYERCPLVYSGSAGLGVLAAHRSGRPLDLDEVLARIRRYWTDGLHSLILVCPGGLRPGVAEAVRERRGAGVHLCTALEQALEIYRERA
jgi:hypothetical protein